MVLPKVDEEQQQEQQEQQQQAPPDEGETILPGADVAAGSKAAAPGEERFVAHMSTLTDIFTVRDKVSTKKSREEKEKDRGFKVASLFDGLAGGEELPAVAAADPTAQAGGFSFAFGSGAAGVTPTQADAGERGVTGSATSQGPQVPPSRHSPGLDPASGPVDEHSTHPQPEPTPASASNAPQGTVTETETALWRPLGDIVAAGARFVRTGKREHVEAAWLGERRALTQDFKRKHKDAVKGRRGAGAGGAALKKRKRR